MSLTGSFVDATEDVETILFNYEVYSIKDIVREVFGGEILFYSGKTIKSDFWMGATDFHIPKEWDNAKKYDELLKHIAKHTARYRKIDCDEEYVETFYNLMTRRLKDYSLSFDQCYYTVFKNGMNEELFQPTMPNGLRLYERSNVFLGYKGAKSWHKPSDKLSKNFDTSFMSDDDIIYFLNIHLTAAEYLKPKLFKSKSKAVRIAKRVERKLTKNISKIKRNVVREIR